MQLIASLTSPFARKVRMVLLEKNIPCELVVDIPWNAETRVPLFNPLGKVPVLALADGSTLFDSRVIAEYLEQLVPQHNLIPREPEHYIAVKRHEALADGIADAAAVIFLERRRLASQQSEEWIKRQQQKIDLGLEALSAMLGEGEYMVAGRYTLADIATVSTLGYLDLRFADLNWRGRYANLAAFMQRLAQRESIKATVPVV